MSSKTLTYILATLTILTLPLYFLTAIHRDEAIFLNIASGITQGYLPYLDYLDNKPPGIYYLFAPLIQIAGNTITTPRIVNLLLNLLTSAFIYKIYQQIHPPTPNKKSLTPTPSNLIPSLIYLIATPIYHGQYVLTETPMALLLTTSTYITLTYLKHPKKRRLLLIGLLLGLAILFKQVAIINLIITAIIILTANTPHKRSLRAALLIVPFLTPILTFIIYFLTQNNLLTAYTQIIDSIIYNYPSTPLFYNIQQLPILLFPAWPIWITLGIYFIYGENSSSPTADRLLGLSTLPIFLILYRPYHHYLIQTLPFAIILITPYLLKSRTLTIALIAQLTFSLFHFNYYIYTTDHAWRTSQLEAATRSANCIGIDDQLAYLRSCPPPALP